MYSIYQVIKLKSISTKKTTKSNTIQAEETTNYIYTLCTNLKKYSQYILPITTTIIIIYFAIIYQEKTVLEKLMIIILLQSIINILLTEMIYNDLSQEKEQEEKR